MGIFGLLNKEQNVQVSDTTNAQQCY